MTITQLLGQNRKQFFRYIIGALLTTVNGLSQTFALSIAFGIIEAPESSIVLRIVGMFFFAILPIPLQYLSRFLRIGFMRDVLIQVRSLAYQKIMHRPIEVFKKQSKESAMAMVVSDINLFEKDFFLAILNIVFSFGSFIIGEIILFIISPTIGFGTLLASSLLYIVVRFFEKPTREIKRLTQEANVDYTKQLTNVLQGLEVIKLYRVEMNFKKPFYQIVQQLENIKQKAFRLDEYQSNLNVWIASSYQTLVYIYATYLFVQDELSLTALILVFNLIGQLIWGMINGFNFINRFKASMDIFERITKVENYPYGSIAFEFKHHLSVKDLSFAYEDKVVLEHVNFEIKPKDKILITGPSGAGKTTLLNCLSQSLSTYAGEVNYDQTEIRDIDPNTFLSNCGYIRQNHFLFNDTIKQNIILNQKYDAEKFTLCLKQAALSEWIESLELKAEHKLEQDGTNISGGQRQRISIARALYHDKDVLFVDEPSASLDDQTALTIYETLLALDKTVILVAHRHLDYLNQRFKIKLELTKAGAHHA